MITTRTLLVSAALLFSAMQTTAQTATQITVDKGVASTMKGLAGYTKISYAFAKGDQVTIDADASKMLDRMTIVQYPEKFIARVKDKKHVSYTFTMQEDGIVVFDFVSDRGGKNTISYTVTRMPASDATRNYVTKVSWDKPTEGTGALVPHQAK